MAANGKKTIDYNPTDADYPVLGSTSKPPPHKKRQKYVPLSLDTNISTFDAFGHDDAPATGTPAPLIPSSAYRMTQEQLNEASTELGDSSLQDRPNGAAPAYVPPHARGHLQHVHHDRVPQTERHSYHPPRYASEQDEPSRALSDNNGRAGARLPQLERFNRPFDRGYDLRDDTRGGGYNGGYGSRDSMSGGRRGGGFGFRDDSRGHRQHYGKDSSGFQNRYASYEHEDDIPDWQKQDWR